MKLFKRIPLCALILLFAFGLFACTPEKNNDGKIDYTVEIVCADAAADLSNVKIQIKKDNALVEEKGLTEKKAVFKLESGTYTAEITGTPDGYTIDGNGNFLTASKPSTTITLTKSGTAIETVDYVITVLYQGGALDGQPAGEVNIQFCNDETCKSAKTGADGVVKFSVKPDNYEIHILETDRPEGYTFDNSKYTMSENDRTRTVYLEAVSA